MIGFTTQEFARMPDEIEGWREEMRNRLAGVDPTAFPVLSRHLHRLANRAFILRWQNGTEAPLDSGFEMFVSCVIAGLEVKLLQTQGRVAPTTV
jgi:hypothetical protein